MIRYLTIFCVLLTQPALAQTNFSFVEYTIEDGLLDDTAYDVVQGGGDCFKPFTIVAEDNSDLLIILLQE